MPPGSCACRPVMLGVARATIARRQEANGYSGLYRIGSRRPRCRLLPGFDWPTAAVCPSCARVGQILTSGSGCLVVAFTSDLLCYPCGLFNQTLGVLRCTVAA